jgi:HTH-type transcriptional regulator / antitoxin HigA
MEVTTTLLDERKYRKLLGESLPVRIRTEEEYSRLLRNTEALMEKPEEQVTEEEGRLLELLAMVIEEYEDRMHPLPKTEPHKMLGHLIEERNLKPSALSAVLPKSRISEILNGKRGISKAQAKQLAELLRVPVEVFL